MGSTTISYAVLALAVGIPCLLAGFFWGRSNLKSNVEKAVEQEHVSLDAREFAMRQQLDEAITEIARLRPLAEELASVRERLEQEQTRYHRMKADFDAALNGGTVAETEAQEGPAPPPQPAMTPQSADEAIQKLLQSLETIGADGIPATSDTNEPEVSELRPETVPVAPPEPIQVVNRPRPVEPPKAVEIPKPKPEAPQSSRPHSSPPGPIKAAPGPVAAKPPVQSEPPKTGETVDEWQEFARSLAALTGRKK
jgi:hypothetical protein